MLKHPYRWKEIGSKSFDCVVCGQMLEHDEFFWLTMLEIRRALKPGGLCCIIAPSAGTEHRYPVDCYRYYPDGLRAAARYAEMEVLESFAQWNPTQYPDMDYMWRDCVMVCRRPDRNGPAAELCGSIARAMISLGSIRSGRVKYGNTYSGETTWTFPTEPAFCTIYFDTGKGFNENETMRFEFRPEKPLSLRIVKPKGCTSIRFDPIEGKHCFVKNFLVSVIGQETAQPVITGNGRQYAPGSFEFTDTEDPQITVSSLDSGAAEMEISALCFISI